MVALGGPHRKDSKGRNPNLSPLTCGQTVDFEWTSPKAKLEKARSIVRSNDASDIEPRTILKALLTDNFENTRYNNLTGATVAVIISL